ncbi:MAG: hypothetical protein IAE79_14145 [Anaerolinea sp.]|nr:hypothetical protein [Anaerolinea sp.]
MKKYYLFAAFIAMVCLLIGLVSGVIVGIKRGVPFVTEREDWTIGIYQGDSPFNFPASQNKRNPVLTAEDVTDVPAKFVADPFLVQDDKTWYLFFEVYNQNTKQGDLAVATSANTRSWRYQQIILDEPFHLSYPYVFKWQDEYYLIPESFEANSIRLYKAEEFPTKWTYVTTLVDDVERVDNSIVYFNDKWWIFAAPVSNDTLHLYYADDLFGPWQEHPESPIVEGNAHISRPSGRVLVYEDRLYRYTMDVNPAVGTHQIWAFEITAISPTTYAETLVSEEPILKGSGDGWNGHGMHQIDPHQIGPNKWLAAVDGYGKYLVFGLKY